MQVLGFKVDQSDAGIIQYVLPSEKRDAQLEKLYVIPGDFFATGLCLGLVRR